MKRAPFALGSSVILLFAGQILGAELERGRGGRGGREGPGPWSGDVVAWRVARDGRVERLATFERAGVATVARLQDGRLLAAHQHFPEQPPEDFDKVAVRFSSDEGATWTAPRTIRVEGLPEGMRFPFDPTLVPLPDGRVRLYFTSVRGRTFEDDVPAIYSATSRDGIRYEVEPGVRFAIPGRIVIDCAVVLHRGTFHLFAPDNGPARPPGAPVRRADGPPRPQDGPPRPQGDPARGQDGPGRAQGGLGYHAVSEDGLTFRRVDDVRIDGAGNWLGAAVSDGERITFYGTGGPPRPDEGPQRGPQGPSSPTRSPPEPFPPGPSPRPPGGGIWIATSEDGSAWTLGRPLGVPGADPGAVRLKDDGLLIVATGGPRRGEPPPERPPIGAPDSAGRWVHPMAKPLGATKNGPFAALEDGTLLAVEKNRLRTSQDDGLTWSEPGPVISGGVNLGHPGHVGQILRLGSGVLVILYLDFDGYRFSWDNEKGAPNPDCLLELWAIRSVDGGKTWTDRQRLLDGYNADFMGLLQAREGQVVATVEHLAPELRRWIACSFVSRDEGKTWERGNWIDLGGHGHHDGATEPMVVELLDGRLMMLIRTSLGQFWRAYSEDGGKYWRTVEPSGIDAASAPGWLLRLRSGRLVLAWNRSHPQGRLEWPRTNWAGPAFERPASMHREELSLSISEDEGRTWKRPLAIAREPGGQLSYPYLFERRPGVLWVFTRYTYDVGRKEIAPLAVEIREEDLLRALEG